mmetsp:Transcript_51136/g.91870  ORF Transcript_51136/g.91870 Transcript_51136/m.91870 type:complete len:221 (+) Transcript_51136:1408-2070(+)
MIPVLHIACMGAVTQLRDICLPPASPDIHLPIVDDNQVLCHIVVNGKGHIEVVVACSILWVKVDNARRARDHLHIIRHALDQEPAHVPFARATSEGRHQRTHDVWNLVSGHAQLRYMLVLQDEVFGKRVDEGSLLLSEAFNTSPLAEERDNLLWWRSYPQKVCMCPQHPLEIWVFWQAFHSFLQCLFHCKADGQAPSRGHLVDSIAVLGRVGIRRRRNQV